MSRHHDRDLIRQVLERYREIDRMTMATKLATGLHCPHRCGKCCQSQKVWATVLECLPLADHFYSIGDEEKILAETEEKIKNDDAGCLLYRPNGDNPVNGRCSTYSLRPMVCRLFGIAFRRNKLNKKELSLCKVIKEIRGVSFDLMAGEDSGALNAPVYQDSFMAVASLHPGIGYQMFPINSAIKRAVEYLYGQYPRNFRKRKAA
jgi:Fe-S-cluster containining protein